jgi:hypothetical protein
MPQKVPFDSAPYIAQTKARTTCCICEIISGAQTDEHIVFRNDVCIAFFARFPTLNGTDRALACRVPPRKDAS